MKRHLTMAALPAALLLAVPAWAEVTGSVDINVRLGDPKPPVAVFEEPPHVVLIPGSTVYWVDRDCEFDIFRYGRHWYFLNEGRWYRAKHYRGPFVLVEARYVPRAVINVPSRYWRNHPHGRPPGLDKKTVVVVQDEKRGHKGKHGRDD